MSRTIFIIGITTLVTILGWTSFEVYRAFNEKQISTDIQKNTVQKSYSFTSDMKVVSEEYTKSNTIKYKHENLDGK